MTLQFGFIDHRDGANLRTLPAEMQGSECLTRAPLPSGTRVTLIHDHAQAPGWTYVATRAGEYLMRGYMQRLRITTDLPEPTATLYPVLPGDRLEPIAARIYRQGIEPGRDLRFYENVIHHVNTERGRKGVRRVRGDVQLVAGERIWLVSIAYANQLQGIVSSGSLTGGALAKARQVAQPLVDIVASVTQSGQYFGEVAGEYVGVIREHWLEITGIIVAFLTAEALSALLAATPTGVGQLAAALIQLGLAAFGAKGILDAGVEAVKHAERWLTQAWQAHGSREKLEEASKSFLRMLTSIAMAALALLGVKSNMGKGLKLASAVKITPPRYAMMSMGGQSVAVPVFQPGSITAGPPLTLPWSLWEFGTPLVPKAVKNNAAFESPLTERPLGDAELEKLLEELPNWDKLQKFVGRRIPKEGTPEFNAFKKELQDAGYRLEKLSEGPQPYRIRRPNGQALGNEYGALTVTENGMVVLKAGKTNRISVYSRYRKNYLDWVEKTQGSAARSAAAARISSGNVMHHLIPDAIAQQHPLLREALERVKGYTIDRGTNILDMPVTKNVEGKLSHSGQHPLYSKYVSARLDTAQRALLKQGPQASWTPKAIEDAIQKVENELRKAIETGTLPIDVLKELREDGIVVGLKLAMLELPSPAESNIA